MHGLPRFFRFHNKPGHNGPRDVFMYRPIASGVAEILVGLGFYRQIADRVLDLPGAEGAMFSEEYSWQLKTRGGLPEYDPRLVLERWIVLHELIERLYNQNHYALTIGMHCESFARPEPERASKIPQQTLDRICWEAYEALSIKLGLDDFLMQVKHQSELYRHLLTPGGLPHWHVGTLLHEVFQTELKLPHPNDPSWLFLEILKEEVVSSDPRFDRLKQFAARCEGRYRPFIMPQWPANALERIRTVLMRHDLQGMAGYLADDFLGHVLKVNERLWSHSEFGEMETRGFGSDSAGQAARRQAYDEFLSWIRQHGRELIDLVTPIGR